MPSSDRLVAVAAHGLAGSRTDLPATPLSDLEWFDLVQACLAADLAGFLAAAAGSGHLTTTAGQADELAALRAEGEGLTRVVDGRALTVSSLLAAAAIEHRVVDGPARRLAYPDAGLRHARSVRVLVAPARLGDAVALLGPRPLGAAGLPVERRARLTVLSEVPGLRLLADPATGGAPADAATGVGATGRPGIAATLGPPATVELEGRQLPVLTLEQQLVATCSEMRSAPVAGLADLRDVAELALSPALDGAGSRRLAEAAGVTDAVAAGVALAWQTFDLADKTELSVWALRMGGHRPVASATHQQASTPRVGLAQRVFGRAPQPVAAPAASGLPAAPAARATPSLATGPARASGPTRR